MINQTWLKTFCTLVETEHFTRTAHKLFMTQSGVSQHIKKLEQQLDHQLIVREGKSFSLTPTGRQLYTKGLELLRSGEELSALIKQDNAFVGNIKIASPGSIGLSLYPHLMSLQEKHSKLSIDFTFAPNKSIERSLVDGEVDVGLITMLFNNPKLRTEKLAEEPLVLVTSSEVKIINWQILQDIGFVSHPDAAHHASLLLSENFSAFSHVDQFKHRGFSNQISLILEPVSRGVGFTVLPLNAAKSYQKQGSINIHRLQNTVCETLYLCENKQVVSSNRVKLIKSTIKDFLRKVGAA
ncbi:LysR family transcriptional regulator [Glaciecola sp. MF2-115]|uniref:LysR family transcriptional regulator n=1 Tax=Glaciecola sp. MF2-115 TaxID=3384827 RepID=UPI00399F458D